MIRFKRFLNESQGEEYGLSNNSKGVVHEILVGAHLQTPGHTSAKDAHTLKHCEHFRDEHGKGPKEVHDSLTGHLDEKQYAHHYNKAKHAANVLRAHLDKHGKGVHKVHWTSNPNDIQKLTGKKDGNNPSDLVVQHHDGTHTGVSMKVQKKAASPTLANPGKKTLKDITGHPGDPLSHHESEYRRKSLARLKPHFEARGHIVHSDHVIHGETGKKLSIGKSKDGDKSLRGIEHQHPDIKEANNKDAYTHCGHAAKEYHDHLKNKKPHELAHILQHLSQSDTGLHTIVSKTRGRKDKIVTEISDPKRDHDAAMSKHAKHLTVHHSGTSIHFRGKDDAPVASLSFKPNSSGGFTGVQGNLAGLHKAATK